MLSLFLLTASGTASPQNERETVIFGSEDSGGSDASPFIPLLRDMQNPVYPEDNLIGALHRRGLYGEELDILAGKIERFLIDKQGEESLVAEETLRAFRRIDALGARADRTDRGDGELNSVRIGRFTISPSGGEASAAIRFIYDEVFTATDDGNQTGTLFFEYNEKTGWQIIGADFNIFRPAERSKNGQYSWKD